MNTNKLAKFLLVLFLVIAPMIIIWVLCAQPNVLGLNWIVPIDGRYWLSEQMASQINAYALANGASEVFTASTWNQYKIFHELHSITSGSNGLSTNQITAILHFIPNFGTHYIFNPIILAPIFGILIFNIVLNICLSLFTKQFYLDIFPATLSSWIGCFTLILCGMLPGSHKASETTLAHNNYWTIAVYIIAIAVTWIVSQILFNLLFNKIIIESKYANIYYEKLLRETKESETLKQKYENEHKKFNSPDDTYVEI